MCAIPFGFAVVPDVYMRNSRSSAVHRLARARRRVVRDPLATSWYQWSRPSVIGTSLPVRRSTSEARTPGLSAIASSATRFSGTGLPRRHASSCVTSTSQPMSFIRSESESAEKPPNTTVCGAPEARAGEHRDRELRHHAHVDRDRRSLADAELLQRVRHPDHVALQVGVGDRRDTPPPARPPSGTRPGRRARPRRAGRRSCRPRSASRPGTTARTGSSQR